MPCGWRNLAHREKVRTRMSMDTPKSIAEIDFANLTKRQYTPSPDCWADQVLYFLMLDRFSDGNENGGYRDADGQFVTAGTTALATSDDIGSVPYSEWFSEAKGWQGGTLRGLKSKLGYLHRLGGDGDLDQSRSQTSSFRTDIPWVWHSELPRHRPSLRHTRRSARLSRCSTPTGHLLRPRYNSQPRCKRVRVPRRTISDEHRRRQVAT